MFDATMPAQTVDELIHLPSVDERDRDEVLDHLITMFEAPDRAGGGTQPGSPEAPGHIDAFVLMSAMLELELADGEPDGMQPVTIAVLAFISLLPGIPEAAALQIAFGPEAAEQQMRKLDRLIVGARQRGLSVDDYIAELTAAGEMPHDDVVMLFRGEAGRAPSAERSSRGIQLLRRVAAHVPSTLRPSLLGAIAWLHWARGQRAIAMMYLAEASRIEPEHVLAYGLTTHFSEHLPAWVMSKRPA